MSKQIQSAIVNNLIWFVASLLIAVMVWFVAKIEANPIDQRVFTRPISVTVDDSMIITFRSSETARVFVNAQESTLNILQPDDIIVSVDLTGRGAGFYTIPLNVDITRPASSDTQPTQINVEIEPRVSQQVPVRINPTSLPVIYEADTAERDIFQAVVSGAAQNVSRVSEVLGEVDLSGQQSAGVVERTITLVAQDANGNRVDGVTIEPASISISVNIRQREDIRTFTVRPDIDFNSLPENFEFTDFDYEPNSIIITASPDVLDSLGDTVDTLPISLENQTGDFTVEVALDLPDDPSLVILSGSSTVEVQIFISEEDATLPIENVPVRVIGDSENSGLSVTVNPVNISVVLTGPLSVIDALDENDVQALVDVNGLGAGNYSLVPRIEVEQGQLSLETSSIVLIPAEVSVTLSSPQPESSPEVTSEADD